MNDDKKENILLTKKESYDRLGLTNFSTSLASFVAYEVLNTKLPLIEIDGEKFNEYKNKGDQRFEDLKEYLINKEIKKIYEISKIMFITFKNIKFPDYKDGDSLSFHDILNNFPKINFDNCEFNSYKLPLENKEIVFRDCTFNEDYLTYNVDEIKILKNNALYDGCTFSKDVEIITSADTSEGLDEKPNEKPNYADDILFSFCKFKGKIKAENITFYNQIIDHNQFSNEVREFEGSAEYKKYKVDHNGREMKFSESKEYKKLKKDLVKIPSLELINCEVKADFILSYFQIEHCDFENTTFYEKVKIKNSLFPEAKFFNTKFKKLADFYQTTFAEVNFERTDFEEIVVFTETTFEKDVDFRYTKFLKTALFRKTVIKEKLDLQDAIFYEDANFLDITSEHNQKKAIEVKNRETARIIKSFFERSSNIIEANKFYALEMEKRKEELEWKNSFLEKLIFTVHSITSNHSQNWFLVLFWIISITSLYTQINLFKNDAPPYVMQNFPLQIATALSIVLLKLPCAFTKKYSDSYQLIIAVGIIATFYPVVSDKNIECFIYNINLFSIFNGDECIKDRCIKDGSAWVVLTFLYRLFLAYLTYQFIISIRQNTRRR